MLSAYHYEVSLSRVAAAQLTLFTAACTHGAIRLVGGETNDTGRLELCYNGEWSAVSDYTGSGFGYNEAATACRQLGYTEYPSEPTSVFYFGLFSCLPTNFIQENTDYFSEFATKLQAPRVIIFHFTKDSLLMVDMTQLSRSPMVGSLILYVMDTRRHCWTVRSLILLKVVCH